MRGAYNTYGRMMTGFDDSYSHSLFGNWRNPEYQEHEQEIELCLREQDERQLNEYHRSQYAMIAEEENKLKTNHQ